MQQDTSNTEAYEASDELDPGREFQIIVNGRERSVVGRKQSYEEIVRLAYPDPNPNANEFTYTVSYTGGPKKNPEGTLSKGQSVFVKNGMIFNVLRTTKS